VFKRHTSAVNVRAVEGHRVQVERSVIKVNVHSSPKHSLQVHLVFPLSKRYGA
jgi:hypothetical protein